MHNQILCVMKKIIFAAFVALISMSFVVSGVVRGSGREAYGEFDAPLAYHELSVARGIRVVLTAPGSKVGKIKADEKLLRHVSITERDGVVRVTYTPASISPRTNVETVVTMPASDNLRELRASSAGKIVSDVPIKSREVEIDGSSAGRISASVECSELSVDLSSAASAALTVVCDDAEVDLSSASECRIGGRTGRLDVETSSAATFLGEDLAARQVHATASSGANARVNASEAISARASSGGSIRYKGAPTQTNVSSASGGSVRRVD